MLPREASAHKAHQITQQELAKMLDINQRTLSTIECCTELITKQIKKLCRVDFELQHIGGFSTVISPFALHSDTSQI